MPVITIDSAYARGVGVIGYLRAANPSEPLSVACMSLCQRDKWSGSRFRRVHRRVILCMSVLHWFQVNALMFATQHALFDSVRSLCRVLCSPVLPSVFFFPAQREHGTAGGGAGEGGDDEEDADSAGDTTL